MTGYTYDLTDPEQFRKLKNNIATMRSRRKYSDLLHIYHQVAVYQNYIGSDSVFLRAKNIAAILYPTILPGLVTEPSPIIYPPSATLLSAKLTIPVHPPTQENKSEDKADAFVKIKFKLPLKPAPSTEILKENKVDVSVKRKLNLPLKPLNISISTNLKIAPENKQAIQLRQYGNPPKAAITISYRNDQGKRMHGAFYDHYTIRKVTDHETKIAIAAEQSFVTLKEFHDHTTFVLGIGKNAYQRIMPEISDNLTEGLLFVPGHPRDDKDIVRKHHEDKLIHQAYYRGQPILAVCAGSWRLWEKHGGTTRPIEGHNYSSMPYIVADGSIGNNVEIHSIQLKQDTLLAGAMNPKKLTVTPFLRVNSVHGEVPNEKLVPPLLEISAIAINDHGLAPKKNRGGLIMEPEAGSIEAFESNYGAPHIGVVWHPEAYYKNTGGIDTESKKHLNLIEYMAKAGDAYQAKRRMLQEFNQKASSGLLLKNHGIFKHTTSSSSITTIENSAPTHSEEKKKGVHK